MSKPLISVIITNYNYADYIGEAISSVLEQSYTNIELVVIDDGSTDNSVAIINKYAKEHPEIIFIKQNNLGANTSRNKGLRISKGEFVFLLDADNLIDKSHIDDLYKYISNNKADVVYTNLRYFGGDVGLLDVPEFDLDMLKVGNFIDTSSLIRSKSLAGALFDAKLNRKSSQDWDFFLGLALKGLKIVKAPSSVSLNYRVHDKQHGNSFKSVPKINQSIEVYEYITSKYAKQFPDQFSNQIKWTNNLVVDYAILRRQLLEESTRLESIVKDREREILALKKSPYYRIGRFLTWAPRVVVKLARRARLALFKRR